MVWQVSPVSSDGGLVTDCVFVRSGLLGFVGPGGMVFVSGSLEGLMQVGGRKHNADDIIATALAVEPMKFIYRGRCVRPQINTNTAIVQPNNIKLSLFVSAGRLCFQ